MITQEQVEAAYAARAQAFRNHADDRYALADYAMNLNLQFAQQQSIENHGKPFDPITGALIEPDPIPYRVAVEGDDRMSFSIEEGQLVRHYFGRPETAWHLFKNGDPDDARIESVRLIEPFGVYLIEIQHSGSFIFNVMIGNSTNHYDTATMIGVDQIILSVVEE